MSLDLAKLKALAEKATPRPWTASARDIRCYYPHHDHRMAYASTDDNAAFIAALVNAFPELCARLEAGDRVFAAVISGVGKMHRTPDLWEALEAYRRLTEEPKP